VKVSVCISIYQSYGALARQVKYFNKMHLPDDVEFIFIDDGSNPPFNRQDYELNNLSIYATGNTLAWTQGLGRNLGAEKAIGEYLLMTDIDHILSREAIEDVRQFTGDRMMFKRYFGILTEDGDLSQDLEVLRDYGLDVDHRQGLYAGTHMATFAIRKTIFEALGGYAPEHSSMGYHPISRQGDDCHFNTRWNRYARRHSLQTVAGSPIYIFPITRHHITGETNPKGLFHNLKYDGTKKMLKGEEYGD
jgi:hypothetical protein